VLFTDTHTYCLIVVRTAMPPGVNLEPENNKTDSDFLSVCLGNICNKGNVGGLRFPRLIIRIAMY